MRQIVQNFKTGELYVDDIPMPLLRDGFVLVENKYSLISVGTEKDTVNVGKASLLEKAKQRPDLVRQVIRNMKKEGLKMTLQKVKTKLEALKALGYSTAGIVKASLDNKNIFQPGDRVACAGQDYASHAEMVVVPQNLIAKIPDDVSFEEASFTTLGAIALQGIRQANPTLGSNICVIGLGLIGQLVCQLLKANGCNVFGIDVEQASVDLAKKMNVAETLNRADPNLLMVLDGFTNGYGFDNVIITAATLSNDPIELSTEILKQKGMIIVVGSVKMNVPRNPHFYRKELELKISCSYGPGRYDVNYEENAQDYPYGYVRWTEQRNMQAFLKLLSKNAIDVKPLISHIFNIEEAEKAYNIVLGKTQIPYVGILLKYVNEEQKRINKTININKKLSSDINVGLIGAGTFAQNYLIPHIKKFNSLDTVVTATGMNAKNIGKKFGFNNISTSPEEVIHNPKIDTVFIATRHDSHEKYVIEAIKTGKNIFVEKPLAINIKQLENIKNIYYKEIESGRVFLLMVGFNRRFAPLSVRAKKEFVGIKEPVVVNIRINAGFISKDHWTQQAMVGGGRIIGEICHFIDLMQFFTNAFPIKIYAESISTINDHIKNDDNISVSIKFSNGSLGNLLYIANGDRSMPKERIEIFAGKKVMLIDDFKIGEIYQNNKVNKIKLSGKGHKEEIEAFINAIKKNQSSPISFESIYYTTITTFKIQDSLKVGLPQIIEFRK